MVYISIFVDYNEFLSRMTSHWSDRGDIAQMELCELN